MFVAGSLTLDEYIDKISSWMDSYSKCLLIVLVSCVSLALHCLSVACLCVFSGHALLMYVSICYRLLLVYVKCAICNWLLFVSVTCLFFFFTVHCICMWAFVISFCEHTI